MEMVRSGIARTTVNKYVGLIRAVFKWGVSHAIVPVGVHTALSTVEPLKRGRSEARETDGVRPVPDAHVDAVRPFISRQVRALIELQLLTAARSGELVLMRAIDLDTSDRIWTYRPAQHKTAHHGHERVIYLGPKAQRVVEPFMSGRALDAFLFSPHEAEAERKAELRRKRTSPPSTNRSRDECRRARPRDRAGDRYTPGSYARAITRACDLAFPPPAPLAKLEDETNAEWNERLTAEQHEELAAWRRAHRWHPHQLRHNAGTRLRREFGVEAAQVVLGHARADVTQIYAEVNEAKARQIIGRVG
jgi:integrase